MVTYYSYLFNLEIRFTQGQRDVLRYKVVNNKMTRRIGESFCPTNTEPFEMAVRSNEVWTYYVYNWTTEASEVNVTTCTLCYF